MADLTNIEKIVAEKTISIVYIQGYDEDGEGLWAYVGIKLSDLDKFAEAQQKPGFDPAKYGVIVESGSGDHPPMDVIIRMEEQFGIIHEKALPILEDRNMLDFMRKKKPEENS